MICSVGLAKSQTNDSKLKVVVKELGDQMERLVVSKDLDAIVEMYGDDAQYLPDASGIYSGKEEIRKYWKQTFTMDIIGFEMETLSVGGDKKRIHETGLGMSTIKYNDQKVEFKFKFVNVWERQKDGSYKLIIDIYNRDAPTE
ncbi:MAG: SnoaL-like domain-containing protein [Roseivirga sp.]|nr:SnoaL-like domain-containing protein [Roseivirga sp.]